MGELLLERLLENAGEDLSTDTVEFLADCELGAWEFGESGRGLSLTEKMERSSPFHMSPHS